MLVPSGVILAQGLPVRQTLRVPDQLIEVTPLAGLERRVPPRRIRVDHGMSNVIAIDQSASLPKVGN